MTSTTNGRSASSIASALADAFIKTPDCVAAETAFWTMIRNAGDVGGLVLLILGESGLGKTTILKMLSRGLEQLRTPEGLVSPSLYVMTPSAPTAISLYEALLTALGDERPSKGTRTQKRDRVIKMLKEQMVALLLLDELQHFYDRESKRVLFGASEALKEILSLYPMSVVCAGLEDAALVVRSNEQLQRRHMNTVSMQRFDWEDATSRKNFRGIVKAFGRCLKRFDTPDFGSSEMALRFFLASGGIIDFVRKIFLVAERRAREADAKKITCATLSEAWKLVLFHAGEAKEDPFLCKLDGKLDTRISAARRINQRVNSEIGGRRARRSSQSQRGDRLRKVGM